MYLMFIALRPCESISSALIPTLALTTIHMHTHIVIPVDYASRDDKLSSTWRTERYEGLCLRSLSLYPLFSIPTFDHYLTIPSWWAIFLIHFWKGHYHIFSVSDNIYICWCPQPVHWKVYSGSRAHGPHERLVPDYPIIRSFTTDRLPFSCQRPPHPPLPSACSFLFPSITSSTIHTDSHVLYKCFLPCPLVWSNFCRAL